MLRLWKSVDQSGHSPIVDGILERWDHDTGGARAFRSSANHVFVFKKDGRACWLRISEPEERTMSLLQAELDILDYLSETSVKAVRSIASRSGSYLECVDTSIGTYYCVAFAGLPRKHYETDDLTVDQFVLWGEALAKLHNALRNAPEQACADRPSYTDHLAYIQHTVPTTDLVVHEELRRVQNWITQLDITPDNFGLIHYDFEQDNLCWQGDSISVLDFDDCANYWYAADVAFALRDLYGDDPACVDLSEPRLQQFLAGYHRVAQVDISLVKEMPWFVRMHNLVTYAKLVHAVDCSDDTLRAGDVSLREKLLASMDRYRTRMAACL